MSDAGEAAALQGQMASAQAEALLAKLRNLPYVSGVNTQPIKPAQKPNHFGVKYYVTPPGLTKLTKRSAVTEPGGDRPTFVAAVQSAIDATVALLTEHGVEINAEQQDADQPPTAEELQWLAEWIEEQPAPEVVTVAMADAALAARRSSQAGSSQADSSQAGSSQSSRGSARLQEVQLQRAQLSAAQRRLHRATAQVACLQAALPEEQAAKRLRVDSATGVPDHPRVASGGANPPHWDKYHGYTSSIYQKLETEEQDRRAIEIDRELLEHDLPRGGETEAGEARGWFSHWRRGVGPTLRGWAKGSLGAIIHMLAMSAIKFGVVDELGAELGFLSKAETRRAQTCIYAVGMARELLSVLKWSKTEEQRQDYHAVLTALAARRSADGTDPDGMIERVAEELGVTSGQRYHKPSGTMRPRAYEQCVVRRMGIDAHVSKHPLDAKGRETTPFCVGDTVLCRSQPGKLHALGWGSKLGGCTVAFEVDGEQALVDYTSFGTGKGGARTGR